MERMFEVDSAPGWQSPEQKSPSSKKIQKKPKPRSFANLTSVMQGWQPSDPAIARRYLVNEVRAMLVAKDYLCTRSCIPALIVDNVFPVDLMHYKSEQDLNELVARMLWMRQEFNSAIGLLLGVPDKETAANLTQTYEGIFDMEEDCVILLM